MLCSPPEPLLAKARFNRVQQKKGFLRQPVLHRPKNLMAGVWRCEKLEVRIICDCAGAYQQVGLGQLLEAGDEVSIPGYSVVSIRPSLSQAGAAAPTAPAPLTMDNMKSRLRPRPPWRKPLRRPARALRRRRNPKAEGAKDRRAEGPAGPSVD